jgi:hypothetical protein
LDHKGATEPSFFQPSTVFCGATPSLVDALKADNRFEEALEICSHALTIAPKDEVLQRTKRQLLQSEKQEKKMVILREYFITKKDMYMVL